jgi:hypothetical protein
LEEAEQTIAEELNELKAARKVLGYKPTSKGKGGSKGGKKKKKR